jgi:dihydroxy-acid dehydratase
MLRSDAWIVGDDEAALEHRAALRSAGLEVDPGGGRPVIGIANSASEFNPCNLPLRDLLPAVRAGVRAAGGVAVEFPVISLGEDLMMPTAMLYRNLLAIEIEEMTRSHPVDGLILLANCDKTVPGALMGAASTNLPTLVITGGARPPARFRGRRLGTGTDLWRLWDERRAGRLDDAGWREAEQALSCGQGACNTMGTASTMGILAEVLGFALPGSSTVPTGDERALAAAEGAGQRIVEMVRADARPSLVCGPASLRNALRVLNAIGGSTNAVIHLAALAGRLGLDWALEDVDRLGRAIPLLADVEPCGAGLMQDFDAAGGVPALIGVLGELLEGQALLADGRRVGDVARGATARGGVIRSLDEPLARGGAFRVVRGSLAPDGAVLKVPAATPGLLRHRGRAVIFEGYEEMRRRVEDPNLAVDATSVLVLRGCGPVGGPGMPEWGMIPIPARLVAEGVRDMVRVTDARMSGTSFGTVFLHVAPEGAVGGPLALVEDGDEIAVDADAGRLDLLVEPRELARRRAAWRPPASPHRRGWPALYRTHVTQAPQGCDLDFLEAPTPADRVFVEPVVGRS